MTMTTTDDEIREIKRRLDMAETKIAQLDGSFQFVTGQLRDIQSYMHARFGEVDKRFDQVEGRLDRVEGRLDRIDGRLDRIEGRLGRIEGTVDALPRVIAELFDERLGKRK